MKQFTQRRSFPQAILACAFFLLFAVVEGCAVINKVKLPALPGLPLNPILSKYLAQQPITTVFDTSKKEVKLFSTFDITSAKHTPVNLLDRDGEGNYLVHEGLFVLQAKSFCLHAGTYAPSQGDGYLHAELRGPRAALIQKLLANWRTKHPQIPQRDVQQLIWAILARVNIKEMAPVHKGILVLLLSPKDMIDLGKDALIATLLDKVLAKLTASLPAAMATVIHAEKGLRELFRKADATYEQFERLAVLAGMAPEANKIRDLAPAQWLYHKNGYFIRYLPSGYSRTTVNVYRPIEATTRTDGAGRIVTISLNNTSGAEFFYTADKRITGVRLYGNNFRDSLFKFNRNGAIITYYLPTEREFTSANWPTQAQRDAGTGEQELLYSIASLKTQLSNEPLLSQEAKNFALDILNRAGDYTIFQSLSTDVNPSRKLQLAGSVAVPANTAKQRLAIADEPPATCVAKNQDIVDGIPFAMHFKGWNKGEILMRTWMERNPNSEPKKGLPVTNVITMDWVLSYAGPYSFYQFYLFADRWYTQKFKMQLCTEIGKMAKDKFIDLPQNEGETVIFNPLTTAMGKDLIPTVEKYYMVNLSYFPTGGYIPGNDLIAALARFNFHLTGAGTITKRNGQYEIRLQKIGLFVQDSYDFNDDDASSSQYLGCWGPDIICTPIHNRDFREWRNCKQKGGDFLIYSDIRERVISEKLIVVPLDLQYKEAPYEDPMPLE